MVIDGYLSGFTEEPGYLDYARVGPLSAGVAAEVLANTEALRRSRFGSLDAMVGEHDRLCAAVERAVGFPARNVVFQSNTSIALMQVLFALRGDVLLSPDEFPSMTFAAARAASMGVCRPIWLDAERPVTAEAVLDVLSDEVTALVVSLVDYRTGYRVDLPALRQVIGGRLLIVDATQGLGVVDAAFHDADVVVSGGQAWLRAGWGSGFLAVSDHALGLLDPALAGYPGAAEDPFTTVSGPDGTVMSFTVNEPDYAAAARLAAALEEVAGAGAAQIESLVQEKVEELIAAADTAGVPVASPRDAARRAGIVTLRPEPAAVTALAAAFFNRGVTVTTQAGTVRLSVHAGTSDATLGMVRDALAVFAA
ncbi:MAG TPA: aminotransferase [Microbacteriaceae bacterium]|nr:aminotransferase [Microbacteriaceae bacterium]